MPREHARILTRIWSDVEFCSLSDGAQRLYMLLLSQSTVNNAGVLPMTVRRWAQKSRVPDPDGVEHDLHELEAAGFVVVDRDTEEVLIRSFIRNDGVAKQPKVLKNACGVALQVESETLRGQLAVELRRVGTDHAVATADALDPAGNASPLRLTVSPPQPDANSSLGLPDAHPEPNAVTDGVGDGVGVTHNGSRSVGGDVSSEIADAIFDDDLDDPPGEDPPDDREDVESLCRHLADRVAENGSKRPRITEKWRREARLLLDRDGRDAAKAHNLIDWSQSHHHWRTRVMAMPKFRSEYDAMRLQALDEHGRRRGGGGRRPSASDAAAANAQSFRRTPRQTPQDHPIDSPAQPQLRMAEGF